MCVAHFLFFILHFIVKLGVVQSSWQADSDEDLTHVQPRRRVPAANNHYQDDYNSKCSYDSRLLWHL